MKYFMTIGNLLIGVVLFSIAPKQLSAQFVEAELTQDNITYFYEQPLVHLEYNRFNPMNNYVYHGQSKPVTLKNTRPNH